MGLIAASLLFLVCVLFLFLRAGWPRSDAQCAHLQTSELENKVLAHLERRATELTAPNKTVVFSGRNVYTKGSGWLVPFSTVDPTSDSDSGYFGMIGCNGKVELAIEK